MNCLGLSIPPRPPKTIAFITAHVHSFDQEGLIIVSVSSFWAGPSTYWAPTASTVCSTLQSQLIWVWFGPKSADVCRLLMELRNIFLIHWIDQSQYLFNSNLSNQTLIFFFVLSYECDHWSLSILPEVRIYSQQISTWDVLCQLTRMAGLQISGKSLN